MAHELWAAGQLGPEEDIDIAAKVSYIKFHEPKEIWVHPQPPPEDKK